MGKVGTEATLLKILDGVNSIVATTTPSTYQGIVDVIRKGGSVPNGTTFTVTHDVYGDIEFVVRRSNVDKVAANPNKPTVTIQPKYLLSVNAGSSVAIFQYDRPEAFASVAETIPANTVCKFTTIAYGGWTAGTYNFTPTADIAAGSKLCISAYQDTALTSCKVNVYASAKATSVSAQYAISSGDGGATVDLGTWGTNANHPQRVSYGSNNEAQSNLFQWLNADTGANNMDSVFVPQSDYDMMDTSFASKKGFLGGFPDSFIECLGLAAIHNVTNTVYEESGYTLNSDYTHNGYFWLPSRKEIYGDNETASEASESQFPYYAELATTNHDKLMYAKGASSATTYWLRTPIAGTASYVRICNAGNDGALHTSTARGSNGVAPLAILA